MKVADREMSDALKNWDFYRIAQLTTNNKED